MTSELRTVYRVLANEPDNPMRLAYVGESEKDARSAYVSCEHAFMNCQTGTFDEHCQVVGRSRNRLAHHEITVLRSRKKDCGIQARFYRGLDGDHRQEIPVRQRGPAGGDRGRSTEAQRDNRR